MELAIPASTVGVRAELDFGRRQYYPLAVMDKRSDPGDGGHSDREAMAALVEAQRLYDDYLKITSLSSYLSAPDEPETPSPNLDSPLNVVIRTRQR